MSKKTCFALPITTEHGEGMWYSEFTGDAASRAFEVYPNIVLVGGIDIMLPDQPPEIVATPDFVKKHEISEDDFQTVWNLHVKPKQ